MSLRFIWNPKKARTNLDKHGVSFEEAETVFADPSAWIYPDPLHSEDENREIMIGQSTAGVLVLVCFTETEDAVRIFSARPPAKNERRKYEEES